MARLLIAFLLLFAGLVGGGCTYNETTEEWQFDAISRDEEIALGAQYQPEMIREFGGEIADPGIVAYVDEIGGRLASYTEGEDPELPWEFTVLNSDVINAFALPGGKVFVSAGLARRMENEAELAAVLGHEIGHVSARHANERAGSGLAIGGATMIASIFLGTQIENETMAAFAGLFTVAGGQLVNLQFSRSQESEADRLGIRYMARAGYNPVGMLGLMRVLQEAKEESGSGRLAILSTHPLPEARIRRVNGVLEEDFPAALASPTRDVFADRFRREMLDRLPPETPVALRPPEHLGGHTSGLAARWCAHCRGMAVQSD
ncbi:MAG: M48 family metallopeptidase [Planctomycetota bacterium]